MRGLQRGGLAGRGLPALPVGADTTAAVHPGPRQKLRNTGRGYWGVYLAFRCLRSVGRMCRGGGLRKTARAFRPRPSFCTEWRMAISRAQGKKETKAQGKSIKKNSKAAKRAFLICLSAEIRTYGLLIDRMHTLSQGHRHEVSDRRRYVDPAAHCRGVAARRHDIVRPPGN